jgi:hypothetical protein
LKKTCIVVLEVGEAAGTVDVISAGGETYVTEKAWVRIPLEIPSGEIARTEKRWIPSAKFFTKIPVSQELKEALSSRHSKRAAASELLK